MEVEIVQSKLSLFKKIVEYPILNSGNYTCEVTKEDKTVLKANHTLTIGSNHPIYFINLIKPFIKRTSLYKAPPV